VKKQESKQIDLFAEEASWKQQNWLTT